MSEKNIEHRERMGLFVQGRNSEVDRLIEETERRLVNTRRFLDQIEETQQSTREMVEKMLSDLEFTMIRLRGPADQPTRPQHADRAFDDRH